MKRTFKSRADTSLVFNVVDDKTAEVMKGSPVTADNDKLPAFIRAIIATKTAKVTSPDKIILTEAVALPSLTALQLLLTGNKSGKPLEWVSKNFDDITESGAGEANIFPASTATAEATKTEAPKEEDRQKLVTDLRTYCKDFEYCPDNRVLDTIKYTENVNAFLLAFMKVTGYDPELLDRAENCFKSLEWKALLKRLGNIKTKRAKPINERLVIYFGSAGTGKSTRARTEAPTAVKLAGSASFDPDDLFTRFDPDRKAFVLTEIGQAMQDGKTIILDEANLYNSVVLQRLQAVLDNTEDVTDRGMTIKIKDGFKVIITMNLETNLGKTPLPNPLVSRAYELVDFDKNPAFKDKTADFIW